MSGRKTRTRLTIVLDACLAGCGEDISPEHAATAIREHETLIMDLIAAKSDRDEAVALLRRAQAALKRLVADDSETLSDHHLRQDVGIYLSRIDGAK